MGGGGCVGAGGCGEDEVNETGPVLRTAGAGWRGQGELLPFSPLCVCVCVCVCVCPHFHNKMCLQKPKTGLINNLIIHFLFHYYSLTSQTDYKLGSFGSYTFSFSNC